MIRFPVNLPLPYPDACHETENSKIYVFSSPSIVVKIASDPMSHEREITFYTRWAALQGSGIPYLLASGRCSGSNLSFLITSNEGAPVRELTEEDRYVGACFYV